MYLYRWSPHTHPKENFGQNLVPIHNWWQTENIKELPQCNKGRPQKTSANNIFHDETQNAFSLRLGKRWGCPLSPFLFNTVLCNKARKRN